MTGSILFVVGVIGALFIHLALAVLLPVAALVLFIEGRDKRRNRRIAEAEMAYLNQYGWQLHPMEYQSRLERARRFL